MEKDNPKARVQDQELLWNKKGLSDQHRYIFHLKDDPKSPANWPNSARPRIVSLSPRCLLWCNQWTILVRKVWTSSWMSGLGRARSRLEWLHHGVIIFFWKSHGNLQLRCEVSIERLIWLRRKVRPGIGRRWAMCELGWGWYFRSSGGKIVWRAKLLHSWLGFRSMQLWVNILLQWH
jgi:hypothetical protein